MIEMLMGVLINPWLGILDRPEDLHANKMQVIEQRLARSQAVLAPDPATLNFTPPPKPPLPGIDGRLLVQSLNGDRAVTQTFGPGMAKWTMTGLIGAGAKRVAILNDGSRDRVVAPGAVIDRQWRVDRVEAEHVVLIPLTRAESHRAVTLYLNTPNPSEE